jgi:hypothetical protein
MTMLLMLLLLLLMMMIMMMMMRMVLSLASLLGNAVKDMEPPFQICCMDSDIFPHDREHSFCTWSGS